jgi:hypothetical protein
MTFWVDCCLFWALQFIGLFKPKLVHLITRCLKRKTPMGESILMSSKGLGREKRIMDFGMFGDYAPPVKKTSTRLLAALEAASAKRQLVRFKYKIQTNKTAPQHVRADTKYAMPLETVQGFLGKDAIRYGKRGMYLFFYPISRKVKNANGHHSGVRDCRTGENFVQGMYLPRNFRLSGIDIESAQVVAGSRGWQPLVSK